MDAGQVDFTEFEASNHASSKVASHRGAIKHSELLIYKFIDYSVKLFLKTAPWQPNVAPVVSATPPNCRRLYFILSAYIYDNAGNSISFKARHLITMQ